MLRLSDQEVELSKPRPSVMKRRKEEARRERQRVKAARRAERAAPCLYADTDRVLAGILGYDEGEIRRLREVGAIA